MHRPRRRRSCLRQLPHRLNNPKPNAPSVHIAGRKQLVRTLGGFYLCFQCVALFREKVTTHEDMQMQFGSLIKGGFVVTEDGVKTTLLGVESRGDRGRAIVRFDLPELQFGYHEYELMLDKKNRVVVVD